MNCALIPGCGRPEYSTPGPRSNLPPLRRPQITQTESEINSEPTTGRRRRADKTEFQARGAFYIPETRDSSISEST